MKYVKVMFKDVSHANGYRYKVGEINIANTWDIDAHNPKDFGGFNFGTEDKILRYLHRGDTIYDVEIPKDAEVVKIENKNVPNGVFRTNKIIIKNPITITESLVKELYKKSNLPDNTYYQCLVTLLYTGHKETVKYIINDRITKDNVEAAIKEFERFVVDKEDKLFSYNELWDDAKEIYDELLKIKNN